MGSKESKEEEQPEDSKYDVECDISSLLALGKQGWEIFASQDIRNRQKEVEQQWDRTRVVAVVGLYNKGKTTVVNMLAGFFIDSYFRNSKKKDKISQQTGFIILNFLEKSKLMDENEPGQQLNKDSKSEEKSDSSSAKKCWYHSWKRSQR
jgi:hypothetical protein